jgi:hypothetical protein
VVPVSRRRRLPRRDRPGGMDVWRQQLRLESGIDPGSGYPDQQGPKPRTGLALLVGLLVAAALTGWVLYLRANPGPSVPAPTDTPTGSPSVIRN